MSAHPSDALELYALGTLEDDERDVVEAHLATCATCLERVEHLQDVGVTLGAAWPAPVTVPLRARRAPARAAWLPIAAAVTLALGTSAGWYGEHARTSALIARDDAALATVAMSHFLHAPFVPHGPGVPSAKALYARDGSWLLVLVADAPTGLHVRAIAPSGTEDLGALDPRGTTSMLYARLSRGVTSAELVDATGTSVATVSLVRPVAPPAR